MDADLFVEMVRKLSLEGGVSSTLKNLRSPPRGHAGVQQLAEWFRKLPAADQEMVEDVMWLTATHVATTFLCILDGAKAIESGPDKGALELYYTKGGDRLLLNDRNKEPLNDKLH